MSSRLPVLTAVTDSRYEAGLIAAFERSDLGVAVVRRCVDLPDLLAAAAAGTARAVILSADLRRLDRDALTRLAVAGLAVVGLFPPGDDDAERRLRQLGLLRVLPADAPPAAMSQAVLEAVADTVTWAPGAGAPSPPRGALLDYSSGPGDDLDPGPSARGRLLAVWGPTGAPGRTTLAVTLASELTALGSRALLVDADTYGGAVAQTLGLLDEAPGLAAAARQANAGTLDVAGLAGHVRELPSGLRVLTGITRAERWPELRPASVEVVLDLARRLAPVVVVDCGFCLEQDEELAYDTSAARRNGVTLTVLEQADLVLAVGSADPVGLARLIRGLSELAAVVPGVQAQVVVNRVRRGVVHGDPAAEVAAALQRWSGVDRVDLVPLDLAGCDAAARDGRTLAEVAPASPTRLAVRMLARRLLGLPSDSGRRLRRARA